MRSLLRSRREGFTSWASMERERSTAMITSRDWSKTCSSITPHCGRARATMHRVRPNQSQIRGRVSAVVCCVPSETSKAPAQARAILGHDTTARAVCRASSHENRSTSGTSSQRICGE